MTAKSSQDPDLVIDPAVPRLPAFGEDKTPTLVDQAAANGWRGGLFNFGNAQSADLAFFNPGLIAGPDDGQTGSDLWLIVRRAKFSGNDTFGHNSLWAFKLGEKNGEDPFPCYGDPLKFVDSRPEEHFEDPRCVYHNGQLWVGACNFLWHDNGEWTGAHQVLGVFAYDPGSGQSWVGSKRLNPEIGGNSVIVDERGRRHEKNWLWWFSGDRLCLLYHSNPWRVARYGDTFSQIEPFELDWGVTWEYGDIRGGTPPVLVDGKYWTFFHSSVPWIGRFRRYYMGAICFDSKPPFTPLYITPEPLLTGSQLDPWGPKKPLVIFPCGAVLRDGEWLITYGVNDLASGWVQIPHADILWRVESIGGTETPKKWMDHKRKTIAPTLRKEGETKNENPTTGRRKTGKSGTGTRTTKADPPTGTAANAAGLNGDSAASVQSAAPAPTIGDEIRYHVSALARLATNANRKTRIRSKLLTELREAKLLPRPGKLRVDS